jgi:hypothetical protein
MVYPPAYTDSAVSPAEIAVVAPSGQRWVYPITDEPVLGGGTPIPFAETGAPGIYTVQTGDEAPRTIARFAVNPFSDLESHIAPRHTIDIGPSTHAAGPAAAGPAAGRREWWRWAAIAGAVVLFIEWAVDKWGGVRIRRRTAGRDDRPAGFARSPGR